MVRETLLLVGLSLAVAACSKETPAAPVEARDPAVVQALNDPLMTDPDLSTRNEAGAALTVRTDGPLPVLTPSADELARARADAAVLLGESVRDDIPASAGRVASLPEPHSPADHLGVLASKTACRAKLTNSTIWAARLPAALPVYPRGATQAATGGDGSGCRVAAVAFTTPVPVGEVLTFYWHLAARAGLRPVRRAAGKSSVLQGQGSGAAFDLRARADQGQTLVELATVTG